MASDPSQGSSTANPFADMQALWSSALGAAMPGGAGAGQGAPAFGPGLFGTAQGMPEGAQAAARALLDGLMSALPKGESGTPPLNPARLAQAQSQWMAAHAALWQQSLARGTGPAAEAPRADDRRFKAREWRDSPWFDYLHRSYLINAEFMLASVEALEADERLRERARFAARQMVDAMSPANFAATNPEAIRLAVESGGETLNRGLKQMVEDVARGRISTTDESAFELGRNIAVSPGAVVFENEVMQLIQYLPAEGATSVRTRPLLLVPPCINKFYILDLQPENSFVRHAVGEGNTVFMVSWRNPEQEHGHLRWDDYLQKGIVDAIDVALDISGADKLNALGFCVGGTMLATALAARAAAGDDRVASLTLLASMLDFSDTGDIGLLVDEAGVAAREAAVGAGGIVPGRDLAMVFSSLRANDLVWNYVVNGYLKGNAPEAFDLLHWNADSTNLPGPWYCWYVRNTYLENNLRVPGKVRSLGQPVDLGRLSMPAYVLATQEDHIVPWRTAYASAALLGGDKRFVLGASGHIAGVINPAWRNKRSYRVGSVGAAGAVAAPLPADAQAWHDAATEQAGSWWTDWSRWLATHAGRLRKPKKTPGNARHRPIEPAPGRYVRQRVA